MTQSQYELILTRESRDNRILISALGATGVSIREYPCIVTELNPYDGSLIDDTHVLTDFEVIVFTSKRGVSGIAPAAAEISRSSVRLAAVGTRTAEACRELFDRSPEFIPDIQTGEALAHLLADALPGSDAGTIRILHVRGNKYNPVFQTILESAGMQVSALEVYTTRIPDLEPLTITRPVVILFASPSAVRGFFQANAYRCEQMICIAIGPVTRDALVAAGIQNVVSAPSSRHEDVVATIEKALSISPGDTLPLS